MTFRGLSSPMTGQVLLCVMLLSPMVVFHLDNGHIYSPSCPACQLANNPGTHTSTASAAMLIPPSIVLSFLPDRREPLTLQIFCTLEFILRSPPADLCS
jgi:hypothetical protein